MAFSSLDDAVFALSAGLLYRVGISVRRRNLTWTADSQDSWEPLNCFVLVTERDAVFLDTGVRSARRQVEQALRQLAPQLRVSVFPSRNEPDCIGNLGTVLAHAENTALLFGGGGGILEWISDPNVDEMQDSSFLGRREIVPALNGMETTFGEDLHFHWIDAPVKQMFLTQWAYEESSATLFSSDFFGWVHTDDENAAVVCSDIALLPPAAEIAREIPQRFNWIPGAHCDEVLAAYDAVVAAYRVDRIAPVHGCVISGADVVAEMFRRTRDALTSLIARTEENL
ncbi:hypothetical protein [Nocardia sp. NBC_00416]|uniref:hypothetical protein n=1 Tax=Nocardia sp. NBC_00416 TaxID=2975991 RepID=UPI002E231726